MRHATFYAPLAAGYHVDHQVIRQVALHWQVQGAAQRLLFYEDYPYVQRDPLHLIGALAHDEQWAWQAQHLPLSEGDLEQRVRAIAAYTSQMAVLFGGEERMAQAVRSYARRVENRDRPAERVWRALDCHV